MRRFRLLGFYVAGLVALIGLTVWAVSMKRLAADAGTPQEQEIGTAAPPAGGPGAARSRATGAVRLSRRNARWRHVCTVPGWSGTVQTCRHLPLYTYLPVLSLFRGAGLESRRDETGRIRILPPKTDSLTGHVC